MVLDTLFLNQCFDKNRLKNLITWSLLTVGERRTIETVEQLKTLGFHFATQAGVSLGVDDLKIPPEKLSLVSQARQQVEATRQAYQRGNLTAIEKLQQLVDTWHRTSETLKQTVVNHFQSTDKLSPVYMMAFSGARGNISQVRQLAGMRGLMADPQGQIIGFPIRSNFREGLTLTEYMISCYGARKGLVDTALRTADAGYLTRRLVDVSQHMVVKAATCATPRGIVLKDLHISNKVVLPLRDRLIGRVLAEDVGTGNEAHLKLVACRNQEISGKLAFDLASCRASVVVRSPLTCSIRHGVCQLCYGWSLSEGRLVTLGEAVGIIAAQSIGEPGTQLTMRTFHTGGVFSGDVMAEIRAPHDGVVDFPQPLQGLLIRTSHGKIAFLTKSPGVLGLETAQRGAMAKGGSVPTPGQRGGALSDLDPEPTIFSLESLTVLFVRQHERVARTQLIAEFSSMGTDLNETIEAKRILFSEMVGQVSFANVSLGTRLRESGDIFQASRGLGFVWILSGRRSRLAPLLQLYSKGSHLVNKESLIARIASRYPLQGNRLSSAHNANSLLSQSLLSRNPLAASSSSSTNLTGSGKDTVLKQTNPLVFDSHPSGAGPTGELDRMGGSMRVGAEAPTARAEEGQRNGRGPHNPLDGQGRPTSPCGARTASGNHGPSVVPNSGPVSNGGGGVRPALFRFISRVGYSLAFPSPGLESKAAYSRLASTATSPVDRLVFGACLLGKALQIDQARLTEQAVSEGRLGELTPSQVGFPEWDNSMRRDGIGRPTRSSATIGSAEQRVQADHLGSKPHFYWFPGEQQSGQTGLAWIDSRYIGTRFLHGDVIWIDQQDLGGCSGLAPSWSGLPQERIDGGGRQSWQPELRREGAHSPRRPSDMAARPAPVNQVRARLSKTSQNAGAPLQARLAGEGCGYRIDDTAKCSREVNHLSEELPSVYPWLARPPHPFVEWGGSHERGSRREATVSRPVLLERRPGQKRFIKSMINLQGRWDDRSVAAMHWTRVRSEPHWNLADPADQSQGWRTEGALADGQPVKPFWTSLPCGFDLSRNELSKETLVEMQGLNIAVTDHAEGGADPQRTPSRAELAAQGRAPAQQPTTKLRLFFQAGPANPLAGAPGRRGLQAVRFSSERQLEGGGLAATEEHNAASPANPSTGLRATGHAVVANQPGAKPLQGKDSLAEAPNPNVPSEASQASRGLEGPQGSPHQGISSNRPPFALDLLAKREGFSQRPVNQSVAGCFAEQANLQANSGWVYCPHQQANVANAHESIQFCGESEFDNLFFEPTPVCFEASQESEFHYSMADNLWSAALKIRLLELDQVTTDRPVGSNPTPVNAPSMASGSLLQQLVIQATPNQRGSERENRSINAWGSPSALFSINGQRSERLVTRNAVTARLGQAMLLLLRKMLWLSQNCTPILDGMAADDQVTQVAHEFNVPPAERLGGWSFLQTALGEEEGRNKGTRRPQLSRREALYQSLSFKNLLNRGPFLSLRARPIRVQVVTNPRSRHFGANPWPHARFTGPTREGDAPHFKKGLHAQSKALCSQDLIRSTPQSTEKWWFGPIPTKPSIWVRIQRGHAYPLSILDRGKSIFLRRRIGAEINLTARVDWTPAPLRGNSERSRVVSQPGALHPSPRHPRFPSNAFAFFSKQSLTRLMADSPDARWNVLPLVPFAGFQTAFFPDPPCWIRFAGYLSLPSRAPHGWLQRGSSPSKVASTNNLLSAAPIHMGSPLVGETMSQQSFDPEPGERGGSAQADLQQQTKEHHQASRGGGNVFFTEADHISLANETGQPEACMGGFVSIGEELISGYATPTSGQIVAIEREKITLRRTQPVLFYAQGVMHVNHGEWVEKNAPILTLTYRKLVTGDIVQGIPKIEQFFEAPVTKEGEPISDSLQARLRRSFQRLKQLYPVPEAVKRSLEEIQQILVEGILKVYLSQGVRIADKHLEIVIRQMTSKGQVLDVGKTGLFQGEDVNLDRIERINLATYGQKADYEPAVLGITQASLDSESFISAASFQETTRVLSRDTIIGKTDFLRGLKERVVLGDLIQAGTGVDDNINYGLLFGLPAPNDLEEDSASR